MMSWTGQLGVGQQADQPRRIMQQQVGPFVGREAARKAEREHVWVEDALRPAHFLARRTGCGQLTRQPRARPPDELPAVGAAQLPKGGVGHAAEVHLDTFHRPSPEALTTRLGPEIIGGSRVPGGNVHAVGHMAYRNLGLWPAREERRKQAPADVAVQAADRVDGATPAHRQVGHVERLVGVVWMLPAEGHEVVEADAELLGVGAEIQPHQAGSKRSKPAGTAVCVVNRLPARVTASATANGWPCSSMNQRARSRTANAAWPSLR